MLESALRHSLLTMLIFTVVPLALSSVVGLLVSIIQAATQVQEQTISYLVKFITISILIFIGGELAISELVAFIQEVFSGLAIVGSGIK